jgi:IS30 family transposase
MKQHGRIINNTQTHIHTLVQKKKTNQNSPLQVCHFLLVRDSLLRCLEVILDNVWQTDLGFLNLPSQKHACRRDEQAVMSLKRMARKKSVHERLGDTACALRATSFINRNGSA